MTRDEAFQAFLAAVRMIDDIGTRARVRQAGIEYACAASDEASVAFVNLIHEWVVSPIRDAISLDTQTCGSLGDGSDTP